MSAATPPWQVDAWDLSADLEKIRQQWTPLREILGDGALYALRLPAVSGWSCGEQAGHIVLVAQAMAGAIEGNLADPERDRDGEWAEFTPRVLESGSFPRGRAKAPTRLDPSPHGQDDFVALLPTVVDAWESIAAREEQLRACPARARHFAFGYLTSAEWVRMGAIHTAHHLTIVRDIRGETGAR
jgi:hypothetical protein